jgi:hypothetical protein
VACQNSLRDEKIEDLQAERTFLAPHGVANVTRCGASRRQARIPVAVCSGRRGLCATFASAAATRDARLCRRWSLGRKAPDSNRTRWFSGHFPLLAGLPSVHDSSRGFAINDPGGAQARACSQESSEGAGEAAEASTRGSEKRLQLLNLQPLRPPPRRVRINAPAFECARGKLKRRRDVARADDHDVVLDIKVVMRIARSHCAATLSSGRPNLSLLSPARTCTTWGDRWRRSAHGPPFFQGGF